MKFARLALILTTALLLGTAAYAGDKAEAQTAEKQLKAQTRCPVMGGKIDSSSYTDIQGQRVYHCCPGCTAKLEADPDKYFKKAAEQGILFENIQTVCPVTGKAHDTTIYTDYVGRRVYFATDEAKAVFAKDPAKYLAILDKQGKAEAEAASSAKKTESDHSSHDGHNH